MSNVSKTGCNYACICLRRNSYKIWEFFSKIKKSLVIEKQSKTKQNFYRDMMFDH